MTKNEVKQKFKDLPSGQLEDKDRDSKGILPIHKESHEYDNGRMLRVAEEIIELLKKAEK